MRRNNSPGVVKSEALMRKIGFQQGLLQLSLGLGLMGCLQCLVKCPGIPLENWPRPYGMSSRPRRISFENSLLGELGMVGVIDP